MTQPWTSGADVSVETHCKLASELTNPRIAVVILSFNQREQTLRCLQALLDKLPGEGTAAAERGRGEAIVYVAEGVVVDTKKFAKGLLEQLRDAGHMDYNFQVVSNHGESLAGN